MRAVFTITCLLTFASSAPAGQARSGWRRAGDMLGITGTGVVLFTAGTLLGLVTTGPLAAEADEICPQQTEPLAEDDPGCLDKRYGLFAAVLTGAAAAALAPLTYHYGAEGKGDVLASYLVMGTGLGLFATGMATDSDALFGTGVVTTVVGPILAYALFDADDAVQPTADLRPDGHGGQQLMLGVGGRF